MGPRADHAPYITTAGSKNPSILAHELGHVDIANNSLGRILQNPATTTAGSLAPSVGSFSGFLTGALSDDERVRRAGVLAPAALAAPQLLYEGLASVNAARRLRGAGASGKQMATGLATLAPAFATYAARAGGGVAGAYANQGIGGAIRDAVKRRKEKKEKQ